MTVSEMEEYLKILQTIRDVSDKIQARASNSKEAYVLFDEQILPSWILNEMDEPPENNGMTGF